MTGIAGASGPKGQKGTVIYPPDAQVEDGDKGQPGYIGQPGYRGETGDKGRPGFDGLTGAKGMKVRTS